MVGLGKKYADNAIDFVEIFSYIKKGHRDVTVGWHPTLNHRIYAKME